MWVLARFSWELKSRAKMNTCPLVVNLVKAETIFHTLSHFYDDEWLIIWAIYLSVKKYLKKMYYKMFLDLFYSVSYYF